MARVNGLQNSARKRSGTLLAGLITSFFGERIASRPFLGSLVLAPLPIGVRFRHFSLYTLFYKDLCDARERAAVAGPLSTPEFQT